jgi:hypothetical protein
MGISALAVAIAASSSTTTAVPTAMDAGWGQSAKPYALRSTTRQLKPCPPFFGLRPGKCQQSTPLGPDRIIRANGEL